MKTDKHIIELRCFGLFKKRIKIEKLTPTICFTFLSLPDFEKFPIEYIYPPQDRPFPVKKVIFQLTNKEGEYPIYEFKEIE